MGPYVKFNSLKLRRSNNRNLKLQIKQITTIGKWTFNFRTLRRKCGHSIPERGCISASLKRNSKRSIIPYNLT